MIIIYFLLTTCLFATSEELQDQIPPPLKCMPKVMTVRVKSQLKVQILEISSDEFPGNYS